MSRYVVRWGWCGEFRREFDSFEAALDEYKRHRDSDADLFGADFPESLRAGLSEDEHDRYEEAMHS